MVNCTCSLVFAPLCVHSHQLYQIINSLIYVLTFLITGITIGFPLGQVLTVMEGNEGAISVCPEILQGVLERDVSVFASTSDITAIGLW